MSSAIAPTETDGFDKTADARVFNASTVSWAAIAAGAFVAAALSLVLLSLGAGLGLSSVSPWNRAGSPSTGAHAAAIVWLIVNEIVSSAMGGYLAGRLRTKWVGVHTDEVYFRDTAHGFLAWSVAVVMTVSFMASASVAMVGDSPISTRPAGDANQYFVDSLFRSGSVSKSGDDAAIRAEAGRVLVHPLSSKEQMSTADRNYLAQLVATQTGLSEPAAQNRVANVLTDATQALENDRKAAAHLLLWIFIALLIGAFSASFAATIGGRQRDHVKTI
jgi:hypothetical protein